MYWCGRLEVAPHPRLQGVASPSSWGRFHSQPSTAPPDDVRPWPHPDDVCVVEGATIPPRAPPLARGLLAVASVLAIVAASTSVAFVPWPLRNFIASSRSSRSPPRCVAPPRAARAAVAVRGDITKDEASSWLPPWTCECLFILEATVRVKCFSIQRFNYCTCR